MSKRNESGSDLWQIGDALLFSVYEATGADWIPPEDRPVNSSPD
jgi:hypothetical protein